MSAAPRHAEERIGARRLLAVAIPATVASTLEPLAGLVDTAFLGRLDSRWLAAMAVCVAVLSAFTWVFNFLVNGVTAQVAQAVGRGDREELGATILLALAVAVGFGVATGALLVVSYPLLVGTVMGADASLTALARPYFLLRAAGMPLVLVATALTGILRGLQRVGLSLLVGALITFGNVVLTYLLLFVWRLGLTGAAIGTVGAFALGVAAGLVLLVVLARDAGLSWRTRIRRRHVFAFGAEASNLVVRTGALLAAFFLSTAVATRLGEARLAAHQIGLQLWLFSSFLIDGLAIAGNVLGGRLIGAGAVEEERAVGRRLLIAGTVIGAGFALVYGLAREPIAALFTRDPQVLDPLRATWPVIALTQPLNALVYVWDGLLFGRRDFAYLRRHMLIGVLLVFVPLLLALGWARGSLVGVWLALVGLNGYRAASCGARWLSRAHR
ncbi:MAG: MATE family efflux transporter [Acidobacteriota bacterium]